MNGFRMKFVGALALSGAMLVGGCKKAPVAPPATVTTNPDGSVSNPNGTVTVPAGSPAAQQQTAQAAPQPIAIRNQDGSITNPDGSVTYPPGSKVANRENSPNGPPQNPTTAPITSATAAPVPAPIVQTRTTVPAGTSVSVRTNGAISAHRNEVGDHFTGTLARSIVVHGVTVFASGTEVGGEVVASKGKGRFKGAGALGIELTSIGRERVSSSEYEVVGKGRGKRSAAFTGGGAGLGALIGGLAGGGKGALIGGLAGAGGGAAAGSYTGSTDVVIPAETVISFRLRSPLSR